VTDFLGVKRQLRVELVFNGDAWKIDYRQPLTNPEAKNSAQSS
jgi:hypothetical protein